MVAPFFDTNVVIDWRIDRPEASRELARYERHRISRIVWTEVLSGEPPESRAAVEEVLEPLDIVEVDRRIAATAADFRHGTRLTLLDALILATARVNGALLVTRNTRDFPATMPGIHVPYVI